MSKSKDKDFKSSGVFNDYRKYYYLIYKDKDYVGEVEYIASLLDEYKIKKG